MTGGSMFAPVTGMEFVGVLGRADAYIRKEKVPGTAEDNGEGEIPPGQ